MQISNDGIMITNRFFTCVDLLSDAGRMPGGISAFCSNHPSINRSKLSFARNNPERVWLKPETIKFLCEDYGVSAEYILFGKGKILQQKKKDKKDEK